MSEKTTRVQQLIQERFKRVLITEYMTKEVERAGFGGLVIQRTPLGTRITIRTERPGLVIGRKGRDIQRLTDEVERRFGLENPQIEAVEVKRVNLNPKIMAAKLVFTLERGWNFRRAGNSMLQRIIESGARGCQITLSGKLTGQRHRTEKFIAGHIKHCGETALQLMQTGFAVARRKEGVIGCKVAIMLPDAKLPDEITIRDLEAEARAAEEAKKRAEADAARKAAKAAELTSEQEAAVDKAAATLEAEAEEAEKAAKKAKGRAKKKVAKKVAQEARRKADEEAQEQATEEEAPKAKKAPAKAKPKAMKAKAKPEVAKEEAPKTKRAAKKAAKEVEEEPPVEAKPAAKKAKPKVEATKVAEAKEAKPAEAKEEKAKTEADKEKPKKEESNGGEA